ncbi:SsgA family sporulation/cell division regulator [Amycolatopsis sp. NPDC059657]|uniref:SsgA family sporulation/cell division regulator n=1 Tax=Amycolatopsis sp. NPDC059657 TaxID=3346899 RepID=UPI003672E115
MTDDYVMLHAKVPFGLRTPLSTDALWVDLTYDTRDPYAIHFAPRERPQLPPWLFSRELVSRGLYTGAGQGDVQLRPSARDGSTLIHLMTPTGRVELMTRTNELAGFLERARAVVPFGEENHWIDFERELARLA